jgi:hypothetical protein
MLQPMPEAIENQALVISIRNDSKMYSISTSYPKKFLIIMMLLEIISRLQLLPPSLKTSLSPMYDLPLT